MDNGLLRAVVTKFYADIPEGTIGKVVKQHEAKDGKWYKLYFGRNKSGKKLQKYIHGSCLKIIE